MDKQVMTVHRALAELKLIDSKIEKRINNLNAIGLCKPGNLVDGMYEVEVFNKFAVSGFHSIESLIDRKTKLKSAIVESNSITNVEIGGKTMTVAEAINFRNSIDLKKGFITKLQSALNSIRGQFNTYNEKVRKTALDNAKIMIGKQGDDSIKPTDEDVKAIVDPFVKRESYGMVDPLDLESKIVEMQEEVDTFEMNIDVCLSESNALTKIEI